MVDGTKSVCFAHLPTERSPALADCRVAPGPYALNLGTSND